MDRITSNYHMHSPYCEGTGETKGYVEEAIRQGLTSMGFASHAPLPFWTDWTMPLEKLPMYFADVSALKARYSTQIEVYAGLELDFSPVFSEFQRQRVLCLPFDYYIGSVHFAGGERANSRWTVDGAEERFDHGLRDLYANDIEALVREYYRRIRAMVQGGVIQVVGHLDRILYRNVGGKRFSEAAPWYREAVEETLQAIAEREVIVELNTAGWYAPLGSPNPSPWVVKRCRELDIRMTVGTDAHKPENVTRGLDRAAVLLRETGYAEVWRLNAGKWVPAPL